MLYLSQMMGKPVVDASGEKIGTISDLAISTGEVFPRITSLAFQGPGKVPASTSTSSTKMASRCPSTPSTFASAIFSPRKFYSRATS